MILKVLILVLISANLFAYVPTVEGLFRNNNNKLVSEDFSQLKVMISSLIEDEGIERIEESQYLKLVFSNKNDQRQEFMQVVYNSASMQTDHVVGVKHLSNFGRAVKGDTDILRKVLYSMYLLLGTNKAELISNVLKSLDESFEANKERLNEEKRKLLESYRRYLKEVKRDPKIAENVPSPLSPESAEEKEKVSEIMKSSMYQKSDRVKLVRVKGNFFWKVSLDKIEALFSNDHLRMLSLKYTDDENSFHIENTDFILFDGVHEFPKVIKIVGNKNNIYRVRILSVNTFNSTSLSLRKKATEYRKDMKVQEGEPSPTTLGPLIL